ncbi:hypothetical protein RJ639_019042 [Escallonia herrerae]|uniref:Uncharacterized protein n=1 Tax=Escallonia herrerae TaxID=1293975 RepID=A0AA89AIY8_9ASTE|nr:hypothetical protein RJ639_019042 [Escallonia herrerae]
MEGSSEKEFHVIHKVPSGDGPYVRAKHAQVKTIIRHSQNLFEMQIGAKIYSSQSMNWDEGPLVGPDWRPKRTASLCISLGVKLGNDTDSSDVATNCCETLIAGAVSSAVRDHG